MQLGQGASEVGDVAHAEAHCRCVEALVLEGQLEQVALDPLERRRLPAGAREHLRGEVEPDDRRAGLGRHDREVTGAAARVEHAVARLHREPHGAPPPALVEPQRHHPVHHVVDRRDPIEHRADALGGESAGLVAHA